MNDPFDSSPDLVKLSEDPKEIEKYYKLISENLINKKSKENFLVNYNNESLYKFAQGKVADLILEFGVACFSMYIMNMPLWANYSNNHKGICLQFNSENDKDFFNFLGPIRYQENLSQIEFSPISDADELGKIFFRKEKSWGYEKEIRLLKDFKGKSHFNKSALRNVIFGYNAELDYINKVYKAVKENYDDVGVYRLEKPTTLGKLVFTEIIIK
ncbi:DUF2971 domain-containing protein [Flavobacterium cellulosilyticum]|uniref:DUF2971 domain-containing protein n=1 Tax=Flavobacterium cellulosilyticum TaxID=2541731 RepID=A0A4R5CHI5_9FLAO|nr:DUF2971 domain-containing protein [Flavobacterium cellulosilyticum]TDD97980.1 DUF2971 domain-containing protein [Flavobacterium cellulosilyticum]